MSNRSGGKRQRLETWIVRAILAVTMLAFVPSAVMKLIHAPVAIEGFTRMSIPVGAVAPIGVVELLCLTLYLVRKTTVLGTLLLTGYLGGATLANIIGQTDFLHALAIGLLVWAGAWLRVPELRNLIPTVRPAARPTAVLPLSGGDESTAAANV